MPRVGEFCAANVSRLLLGIAIVLLAALAIGYWFFYSPGQGRLIEDHAPASSGTTPAK